MYKMCAYMYKISADVIDNTIELGGTINTCDSVCILYVPYITEIKDLKLIFLVQVRLWTEHHAPLSGLELMTSRSWQYISCHWDACSNH